MTISAFVLTLAAAASVPVIAPSRIDDLNRAAKAAYARDDIDATVAAMRALVDECVRVRALAHRGVSDADVLHADDGTDNALRYVATTLHARAKERVSDADLRAREKNASHEMYALYLAHFARSANAYEMRFFHAELLYSMARFPEAAREYALVMQAGDGKWREVSAEETVRAWDEQRRLTVPRGNVPGPRPYAEAEHELLAACVRYLTEFPRGKLGDECAYREAMLRYDVGFFDESTLRFERVIAERRGSPRLEEAIARVQDTHLMREDYVALSAFVARVRADPDLMRNPEIRSLVGVLE